MDDKEIILEIDEIPRLDLQRNQEIIISTNLNCFTNDDDNIKVIEHISNNKKNIETILK